MKHGESGKVNFRPIMKRVNCLKNRRKYRSPFCCTQRAQDIHAQFQFLETEDKKDWRTVLKKFREYCKPLKNTVFERYKFWSRDQAQGETVDQLLKDLKIRAGSCEFGDQADKMVRDKLVFGVGDERVKERLLRESELTLTKAVDLCHAAESTNQQLREMTTSSQTQVDVNFVNRG